MFSFCCTKITFQELWLKVIIILQKASPTLEKKHIEIILTLLSCDHLNINSFRLARNDKYVFFFIPFYFKINVCFAKTQIMFFRFFNSCFEIIYFVFRARETNLFV